MKKARKTHKKILLFSGICVALTAAFFIFELADTQPLSAQVIDENPEETYSSEEGESEGLLGKSSDDLLGRRRGKTYVTVRVKDDLWGRVRVESAELEGRNIRLKRNPDVFGTKGSLTVQLSPGSYTLRWTVTKPGPRRGNRITLSFRKRITVSRNRGSVNVIINGQNATVL